MTDLSWVQAEKEVLSSKEALVRFAAGMESEVAGLPGGRILRALSFHVKKPGKLFFWELANLARTCGFTVYRGAMYQKQEYRKGRIVLVDDYLPVWVLNDRPPR